MASSRPCTGPIFLRVGEPRMGHIPMCIGARFSAVAGIRTSVSGAWIAPTWLHIELGIAGVFRRLNAQKRAIGLPTPISAFRP